MSQNRWPSWRTFTNENDIPFDELVPCSPNNPTPCYVVGMFDDENHFRPRLGYVYYYEDRKSFSRAYLMEGTVKYLSQDKDILHFLVGGDVSFRPQKQVPENLRFTACTTNENKPIYIGTLNTTIEEICGPVIDGVCYSYNAIILAKKENFKILALNGPSNAHFT